MQYNRSFVALFFCLLILSMSSCFNEEHGYTEDNSVKVYYNGFPVRDDYKSGWEKFAHLFQTDTNYVNEFGLTRLPPHTYKHWQPASTLPTESKMIVTTDLEVHFFPLDQDTAKQFQYVHQYNCVYDPQNYRYADVAYPNPCLPNDPPAKAKVVLINKSNAAKTIHCRLFYQNNSYWFSTGPDADFVNKMYLSNYYGGSKTTVVQLAANSTKEIFVEYVIGQDPKGDQMTTKKFYGPARPGAYEFMLWATEDPSDPLIQDSLDYTAVNPFAYFQEKRIAGDPSVMDKIAHTNASHFKFITLQENFKSGNIYHPGDVYKLSHRDAKPLCDTCTGYFRDVIANEWEHTDYFEGFISKAPWIKAEYGGRKENVRIDENGIYLRNPGSTDSLKQKTWGEAKFAPSFLYGTVKVVAKFSQLRNKKTHTPTGIIHNLWLYQHNHPYADPIEGHPYAYLTNSKGKQPYEIDIEIWSKIDSENWNGGSEINYSIVDYMRDENVTVKPGEIKRYTRSDKEGEENKRTIDRLNNIQLNVPCEKLLRQDFFDQYHLYEIVWSPYDIHYKIDGEEVAKIDWTMAKIPDEYAFLWVGSPMYQDGTYYSQNSIPFLPSDQFSHVRYISIE